ncbi:MAG: decaprenyl-phosphate phosphoribosyltransferase [Zoogloeaceae bacterium]|jgi:4-hydroxybenzoate polyprenyltransferase|nr:decaprenyl-phosphate phosphoribosyltransferase [Zoogloeaceae bacterium]
MSTPAFVALLRPAQWTKQVFVLAPLLFTGGFAHGATSGRALLATALFCLLASAVYIVNDWKDLEADRQHPKKRLRPLACGAISKPLAACLLAALLVIVLGISLRWLPAVLPALACYLALNVAYSFWLKHLPVVDIFALSGSFVLRVWAGALAIDVPVSSWMFITALSLALYMGTLKRRQELLRQSRTDPTEGGPTRRVLAAYSLPLLDAYAQMASGAALVFYSLYAITEHPPLVATVPLVMFGLFRYQYIAQNPELGESPTDAIRSDGWLLACALVWAITCAWLMVGRMEFPG